jgi:hypothetical protein
MDTSGSSNNNHLINNRDDEAAVHRLRHPELFECNRESSHSNRTIATRLIAKEAYNLKMPTE